MTDPDRTALRQALAKITPFLPIGVKPDGRHIVQVDADGQVLPRTGMRAAGDPFPLIGQVFSYREDIAKAIVALVNAAPALLDALDRAKTDLKAYTRLHCQPEIADHCPRCGGRSLFIARSGWLTCANLTCKCPGVSTAVEALRERAEKAEAELEQAFREGYQAGASRHGYEPDAVAAWRERRAAERGGK